MQSMVRFAVSKSISVRLARIFLSDNIKVVSFTLEVIVPATERTVWAVQYEKVLKKYASFAAGSAVTASASKSAAKSAARLSHRRWGSDGRATGGAGGEGGDDGPNGRDTNLLQLQPFQRQVCPPFNHQLIWVSSASHKFIAQTRQLLLAPCSATFSVDASDGFSFHEPPQALAALHAYLDGVIDTSKKRRKKWPKAAKVIDPALMVARPPPTKRLHDGSGQAGCTGRD